MAKAGDRLVLPVDAVIADKFEAEANSKVVAVDAVPAGWRIMDIGPKIHRALQVGPAGRQADRLEWTHGCLRDAQVR